ncbi:MAG TPA: hypothetical protein DCY20_06840, partial [Firmicutes bacterium]|nr:hypothetical protein [Bacillota bacterium]
MLTIQKLKEISFRYLDQQAIEITYMLNEVSQLIVLTESTIIYPKNLYHNKEQLELYIFYEQGQILKVTHVQEVTKIETMFKHQLTNITYESGLETGMLELSFVDGRVIKLTPHVETNHIYR